MHGLVIQRNGPARIVTRQRRRVIARHLQKGDRHLLGEDIRRMPDFAERPLGIQSRAVGKGKFGVGLRVDDSEIVQPHGSGCGRTLQDIGPDRTHIDSPVQHGEDHFVVDTAEYQCGEILIWIDTFGVEFAPGHLKSAKRRFVDCHEPLVAKILQARQVDPVPARKNYPAEDVVGDVVPAAIVHGSNARNPVLYFEVDVDHRGSPG